MYQLDTLRRVIILMINIISRCDTLHRDIRRYMISDGGVALNEINYKDK